MQSATANSMTSASVFPEAACRLSVGLKVDNISPYEKLVLTRRLVTSEVQCKFRPPPASAGKISHADFVFEARSTFE